MGPIISAANALVWSAPQGTKLSLQLAPEADFSCDWLVEKWRKMAFKGRDMPSKLDIQNLV
jgi:hypothetical protein